MGATLDGVPEAEPAELGAPFPAELARALAEHERPRLDRLRGGVEEARPLGAAPVHPAIADVSPSKRPSKMGQSTVPRQRPRNVPAPVNPAAWASGLPSARLTRVSTTSAASRSSLVPSTSRRARSSSSISPPTRPFIPGPRSSARS